MKKFSGSTMLRMKAIILFAASLVALPGQAAAGLDDKVEAAGIFHDQGPVFDSWVFHYSQSRQP